MAVLDVITYPNPILTKKTQPITSFGDTQQRLFDDMIETMYVKDGVGLAGPQVGVSKSVLVISPRSRRGEEYVLVNPEIYETEGQEIDTEGCLSFPGISLEIVRAKKIRVRYQDRHGKKIDAEIRDFFARVVQHEADHLNGIVFIDRVDFGKRQELLARYRGA